MMNRLGIYFFYDSENRVDDYVPVFLKGLRTECQTLIVVVNGALDKENHDKISQQCDVVLQRENTGFDSWAYKHGIEYVGYDALRAYDELLLCNFTCFGPIFPFAQMFSQMSTRPVDLWGVHRHPALPGQYILGQVVNEHIQSHFIVFKNSILKSPHFQAYWNTLKPVNNYQEARLHHELRCSAYFEDLGFTSSCYVDAQKYFDFLPRENASLHCAYKQMAEDLSPILKRKVYFIAQDRFAFPLCDGYQNIDTVRYLRKYTDYDTRLIFDNIARTQYLALMPCTTKFSLKALKYKFLAKYGVKGKSYKYRKKLQQLNVIGYRNWAQAFFGWRKGKRMARRLFKKCAS